MCIVVIMNTKNPQDILRKYKELAQEHNLLGWSVRFLRKGTYRCYGLCNYRKRELSINQEFCEQASEEEILDVMLHEIAHALIFVHDYPIMGKKALGHGREWKMRCIEVGADPTRLYKGNVKVKGNKSVVRKFRYALVHEDTGEIFHRYMRLPRHNPKRLYMPNRKAETLGKMKLVTIS